MTNENANKPSGGQSHGPMFFFMDAKKFDADKASMTALEIKQKAGVPGEYQLFLEATGNEPDRAISDTESFTIGTPPLHFYSVPPATFGSK